MRLIKECPVCESGEFKPKISCKDYTVSHETFLLDECKNCGLIITNPQPGIEDLARYYLSENYISHTNKSASFLDLIYRLSRTFTLNWKHELIRKYSNKNATTLLDYGCGTGDFLKKCLEKGYEVQGVEPSQIARKTAKEKTGVTIESELNSLTRKIDIITAWHVLEHVPDVRGTMSRLRDAMDENSTIFVAVPNASSFDAIKYKTYWAGYDVPRHLWHFSKVNMKQLLENAGFELIKIIPMKLDSFYVSILSEKYLAQSLNPFSILRGVLTGLQSNLKGRQNQNQSSLIYIARKK